MGCEERTDDFQSRRDHLRNMADEDLHAYFWQLTDKIIQPLVEEARIHTTPSIERSVLLRMGFSSIEAKVLVDKMRSLDLLGHGAGRLVLELAKANGISVRQAGEAMLAGQHWEKLPI